MLLIVITVTPVGTFLNILHEQAHLIQCQFGKLAYSVDKDILCYSNFQCFNNIPKLISLKRATVDFGSQLHRL